MPNPHGDRARRAAESGARRRNELRTGDVVEIRDGKFVKVTIGYESREQALEAVGLSAHAD